MRSHVRETGRRAGGNWFVSFGGCRLEKFEADFTPKYFVWFIRSDVKPIRRSGGRWQRCEGALSVSLGLHLCELSLLDQKFMAAIVRTLGEGFFET